MAHDGAYALVLVLLHDRSLAHDMYPVCQELAAAVVSSCSRVKLYSVADLALLLDSPRWASSAQQRLKRLSLGGRRERTTPAYSVPGLHAWITEEEWEREEEWDLASLLGLACKCRQLQVLHINACGLRDWAPESIAALAAGAAEHWPLLEHLGVEYGLFNLDRERRAKAAALLAAANTAPWQRLRHLRLSGSDLGFKAAKAIAAAAPQWSQLQLLDLYSNRLGSRGVQALMKGAQHWPLLQCLRLGGNNVLRATGAAAIAAAGQHFPQLTELHVPRCQLGPQEAVALMRGAKHWPCMQRLHMNFNDIGPKGARALAAAAVHWPQLQSLEVRYNKLGREGVEVLEPAYRHWPRLTHAKLDGNGT